MDRVSATLDESKARLTSDSRFKAQRCRLSSGSTTMRTTATCPMIINGDRLSWRRWRWLRAELTVIGYYVGGPQTMAKMLSLEVVADGFFHPLLKHDWLVRWQSAAVQGETIVRDRGHYLAVAVLAQWLAKQYPKASLHHFIIGGQGLSDLFLNFFFI